ncbi:MAG: GTP-binding protein [Planctomycetota bacterium]|nr:MAG: GTP-binding protein [Planctomycetota bacterium]
MDKWVEARCHALSAPGPSSAFYLAAGVPGRPCAPLGRKPASWRNQHMTKKTYTWLVPNDPAAIALCLLRGSAPPLDRAVPEPGLARFAHVHDLQGAVVDEVVVTALAEDAWEIACHGGPGMRAAMDTALSQHGFQETHSIDNDPWQDWSSIVHPAAVRIMAREGMDQVYPWWHLAHRPIRILLTGPVNAGKSTLLNTWCGQQRAVASAQPGTTRDLVRTRVQYAGWIYEITDSAGLRASTDAIEQAGQQLITQARSTADVVLYCWPDDAQGLPQPEPNDQVLITKWDNKSLPSHHAQEFVWHAPGFGSAQRSEELLERLQKRICTLLNLPCDV